MRVLILSDIHANFVALETVVAAAAGQYDAVWCLGDVVGYGPAPNECVEFVREHTNLCVIGNHDWAVLGRSGIDIDNFNPLARQAVLWTQRQLSQENRDFLDSLPAEPLHPDGAGNVLITHASPRKPVWEYVQTPTIALENFACFDAHLCLVGHTHQPAIYRWRLNENGRRSDPASQTGGAVTVDFLVPEPGECLQMDPSPRQRLILNPGSVGQPRDNDPRAAFGLLDLDALTWEVRRVAYPVDLTQSQMRAANLPRRLIDRLNFGW